MFKGFRATFGDVRDYNCRVGDVVGIWWLGVRDVVKYFMEYGTVL